MAEEELVKDIEESSDVLEEDTAPGWVGQHKRVLSNAIDYTLNDLAEQAVSGELDLQPSYQRRHRWNDARKSRLIESFLMNVPVPPVFLSEEPDGVYAVIDGKQRITAIADFLERGLVLKGLTHYTDLNGSTFNELSRDEQRFLSRRIRLRAVIVLAQSPPEIKLQTFQRLNTGGVQLNAQEIRNIAFRGPLNDLIMKLSVAPGFHKMLGIKDKERSAIHQQMRDAELVLRFLAFREDWTSFKGSIKGQMDSYMETHRSASAALLQDLEAEFLRTLDVVQCAFGENAFERWQPEKQRWRHQVVAALYDAEMLAAQSFERRQLDGKRNEIISGLQGLFRTKKFREATEAATNARKAFEYRVTAVRRLLNRHAA